MKKEFVILALFLFLVACSSNTIKIGEQQANQQTQTVQPTQSTSTPAAANVELKPEFKLVSQQAIRTPPTVKGVIANKGLGAGTVKVTARLYYAEVIAAEKSQEITIKSKEEGNFSMVFDNVTQWVAYKVLLETID